MLTGNVYRAILASEELGQFWFCCCCCCLVTKPHPTLCDPTDCRHTRLLCPSLSPGVKLMSTESLMPSNHLIICRPLLLLPSVFPSIRVFSNDTTLCIRWPKYWSCSFSISPSNEYSGLISFGISWFDLLGLFLLVYFPTLSKFYIMGIFDSLFLKFS